MVTDFLKSNFYIILISYFHIGNERFLYFAFKITGQYFDQIASSSSSSINIGTFDITTNIFFRIIFEQFFIRY